MTPDPSIGPVTTIAAPAAPPPVSKASPAPALIRTFTDCFTVVPPLLACKGPVNGCGCLAPGCAAELGAHRAQCQRKCYAVPGAANIREARIPGRIRTLIPIESERDSGAAFSFGRPSSKGHDDVD